MESKLRGPMLCGPAAAASDATLFPSMCLLHCTLPAHYGWTEWTEEAIFWKRPRLHAWFELMQYDRAARKAQGLVEAAVEEMQIDWDRIAIPVPTARLRSQERTYASHAL
mmetsp:Transcript_12370/g.28221  ORF Transcript_12370/g.28221 Transcript_12370/m.28221 type:complete len:110 (-) Transcript_12370:470-799(-)